MHKYVIERTLPGAGQMSATDLRGAAATSVGVLRDLGPDVQWVHSYVTADKVYCVFNATDPGLIHEHARRGGFPLDTVVEVATIIDPTTAET